MISSAELFAQGNYTGALMTGNPDQWETYASMGLIGKTEEAIKGLSRFDNQEAHFYSAAASWIGGDEVAATHLLETIPTPHAQNLLSLIRKPQIQVLAQLPWTRRGPQNLLAGAGRDPKFQVTNISFDPKDLRNEPYANIGKFYNSGNPPDFYVCQMVEWHLIPPNIQQLPCPVIGQTADYDLHIQAVYPWLQLFDEMVVTDGTEWQEVRRLINIPVSTFPKSFGVADRLPPIPSGTREIDVFLSGTLLHPYGPEKATLIYQILRESKINVRLINGFVDPSSYNALLGHSKVIITHVRRSGSTPTRGIEALSMGCAVLVQSGNVLTLFAGEECGVLTYESHTNGLLPVLRRILAAWPQFQSSARRGAEIIRRQYSLSKVASQYLRFLTFLAARPRGPRMISQDQHLFQKRNTLWKSWLPGGPTVLKQIRECNFQRWDASWQEERTPRLVIDLARELVLEYALLYQNYMSRSSHRTSIDRALGLYSAGISRFPKSLVLRFNLVRTALHFGSPEEVSVALRIAGETLRLPEESWHVDPLEDVFPWDFCSPYFNYRRYFDLVTQHYMLGTDVSKALAQLILASLSYYLSHYSEEVSHLKRAIALDPEFPSYKLRYALLLLKRNNPGDHSKAASLLAEVAEGSILFMDAFDLVQRFEAQRLFRAPWLEDLSQIVGRAASGILFLESLKCRPLQPSASCSMQPLLTDDGKRPLPFILRVFRWGYRRARLFFGRKVLEALNQLPRCRAQLAIIFWYYSSMSRRERLLH